MLSFKSAVSFKVLQGQDMQKEIPFLDRLMSILGVGVSAGTRNFLWFLGYLLIESPIVFAVDKYFETDRNNSNFTCDSFMLSAG